jgi:muramidase (phage lysozyme)
MNAKPLLDLIGKHEADGAVRLQGAASAYDVVWGGIKASLRPSTPISKMTARGVQSWQVHVVKQGSRSSAAGRYQFIRATLGELIDQGHVSADRLFDATAQDNAAIALLNRRGWQRYLSGAITDVEFAENLAKEWASFPVMTGPKKGRSYYAGDGLNAASAKPKEVLAAVRASKVGATSTQEKKGWIEWLLDIFARLRSRGGQV